jgi:putative ABC transport system substrate-binding protein
MRRREFITLIGGATITWPIAAHAQRPLPLVGFLAPGQALPEVVDAFRSGLSESGFVEGRNVAIESRYAGTDFDRLPTLGAELVSRGVKVIYAMGASSAVAAKATITTIPVVFYMGEDPVSLGVVQSFNRPRRKPDGCRHPQLCGDGQAARTAARIDAARRGLRSADQSEESKR